MKLATLDDGTRDGALQVVSHDGTTLVDATDIAPTLQAALDAWAEVEPKLRLRAQQLEEGTVTGQPVDVTKLLAPLPRAYEWVDGSAYINHVILVRKARNAEPPETLRTDPLVYQGGSSRFLAPTEDIPLVDPAWGLDFEAEIVVFLDDTPQGTTAAEAAEHIKLVGLINDVTLRNLIPTELKKGFGFFQSKPASALSPFVVTPDELGDAWQDGRLSLEMLVDYNGDRVGHANAGPEMHFSFHDLVQHIAKTRGFTAGTILGSGTVSNEDWDRGYSCLAEQRMKEIISSGEASTPFMKDGDTVRITVQDGNGDDIFGVIDQKVVAV